MAKASLAAQSGTLTTGELKLPSIFQATPEPVQARALSPYITFAHPKRADEWKKLTDKFGTNIEEGDMFLIRTENIHRLDPAKLGWFVHKQFWAETNAAGDVLAVSWKELPKPYKEYIEAVVLVYLEDRLVPANVSFRTTKCPAAKIMADAFSEASGITQPGSIPWVEKSAAHKETLICEQPFMRFYGDVTLGPKRIGKGTGMPYRPTQCNVKPTSVPEWRMLKEFIADPLSQKALEEAAKRFQFRMNDMTAKVR